MTDKTEYEILMSRNAHLAEVVFGEEGTPKSQFPPQPPELSEDDFDYRYKPRSNPEGSILWERDQILPLMDAGEITDNNVWSVVDADNGGTAAIAGWHVVDVFSYMVTQIPWMDGREGMVFDQIGEDEDDIEGDMTL